VEQEVMETTTQAESEHESEGEEMETEAGTSARSSNDARSTFLPVRDVVSKARTALKHARECIAEALRRREDGERERMFIGTLERHADELDRAIERGIEEAPDGVLDAHVQYVSDALQRESWPEPDADSVRHAYAWLREIDRQIADGCFMHATRESNPGVHDLFASLADLVQSHDRLLARQSETLEDL
jgi:hypothetical protein